MKNEIENGLRTFIIAALRVRDSLAEDDALPVAVHAASGDEEIDETAPYIVCQVTETPHLVGGIGHAALNVLVSSPHATGYETAHATWHRFLRAIFVGAIAPDLPANIGHISEAVWAATGDDVSVQGFYIDGYPGSSGQGQQQDGISITLGIYKGALAPIASSLAIQV